MRVTIHPELDKHIRDEARRMEQQPGPMLTALLRQMLPRKGGSVTVSYGIVDSASESKEEHP